MKKNNFKIGDYVIIKEGLKLGFDKNLFVIDKDMVKLSGKLVRITNIYERGYEINNRYYFPGYLLREVKDDKKSDILDYIEFNYLLNIIRPFIDKVVFIAKLKNIENDYCICIGIKDSTYSIILPSFKDNNMYKGMIYNKHYSLEELGFKKRKSKLQIGDKVMVINEGVSYPSYVEWFKEAKLKYLVSFYKKYESPNYNDVYTIIAKHKHINDDVYRELVCAIKNDKNEVFLISEDGLKKYEGENENGK